MRAPTPDLATLFPDLLGPGAAFELRDEPVLGTTLSVFVDRPRSLREVLLGSREHGAHPYLLTDDIEVSYQDHVAAATTLGGALREQYGVGEGDRVAILAANSVGWIEAFWAAQWIGAIPVGLNAWWAPAEVREALDHCEPAVVVTDERRRRLLPEQGPPVLSIEQDLPALTAAPDEAWLGLDLEVAEDDPAVILYTSGTSGRPKGVVHSHRNLGAVIKYHGFNDALARAFGLPEDPPRRDFMILPLFHIASLHNLAVARLGQGTSLVLYEGRFEARRVLANLERHRVTNWGVVPTMARRLIRDADPSSYDLSAMRTFALASAPSSPRFHQELRQQLPVAQALSNSYGLTESATAITVATPVDLPEHPGTVGRPIISVEAQVRGPDGAQLPDGEQGEVWARSQFNMVGYWRDPEATRRALTEDRWLRTGDLGRFEDGLLYLDTRRSDLIIRGGENVHPAEVEARLLEHPQVEECVVVGVDDDDLGQQVAAVVTVTAAATITATDLADFVRQALAYFKVPTRWHLTTEPLPRNATGKVVRRQIPDLFPGDQSP